MSDHLLAFGGLAVPLSACRPRLAPWPFLATMAHGGAIELIQPLVRRAKEALDFLADA